MMLSRNQQAFHQFVAAATLTTWGSDRIGFASARVGRGLREAPLTKGYDATAPLEGLDSNLEVFYHIPGSEEIEKNLQIVLENESDDIRNTRIQETTLQNTTSTTTILRNINIKNTTELSAATTVATTTITGTGLTNETNNRDLLDQIDLGILQPRSSTYSAQESLSRSSSTCMMGFHKEKLVPADAYLRHEIESGRFAYSQILFDEASNTVFCNQKNDMDDEVGDAHHTYGCASMHFRGCATVKCNGKESCIDTTIEDAIKIECEGYESCRDAKLDASTVDCGGEAACMSAIIGSKSFVNTLDCHSGESACAYAKTRSVGSVFCTGPLSCYGAEFLGVRHSVICQGVPHPHSYYMPTCGGGKSGTIEAETNHNIDVVCDGDFACIGPGHNDKYHPSYFGIDVGDEGMLTCGGSLLGNQDGVTFVCKYLDLAQECSSYQCKEPAFALADHAIPGLMIDNRDLQTCNHVFSLDEGNMCTGEKVQEVEDNDGDDDDDDDEDGEKEEEDNSSETRR